MMVTKSGYNPKNGIAKKGEVIGIEVQIGSKKRNEQARIFAEKYVKKTMAYFFVKSFDQKTKETVLVNLDTKEEFKIEQRGPIAYDLAHMFREQIKEFANRKLYVSRDLGGQEPNTLSTKISIYPTFIVTSLNSELAMQDDGTFKFSMEDVDGIYLNQKAKDKVKIFINSYF